MIGYIWDMKGGVQIGLTGFRYSGVLTPSFEEDSVVHNRFCRIVYDWHLSNVVDSL
jgi:hypothetical protein